MPPSDPTPPDRSRRAVIVATVGIVVIMGLAVFYVAVVAPLRETHVIVREFGEVYAHGRASTEMYQQKEATQRLGGPDRAADRLARYLRLPKWMSPDRVNATRLLGWCGPRAVPVLVQTLGDANKDVRRAAASALSRMGDVHTEGWGGWRGKQDSPALKEAVPALVKALNDPDREVRLRAIGALGAIGPEAKEAVPALVRALGDRSASVRQTAVWVLGRFGPDAKEAVPALIRALDDRTYPPRANAVVALGRIGPEAREAIPALERLLKSLDPHRPPDSHLRKEATEALKKIRGADAPEN